MSLDDSALADVPVGQVRYSKRRAAPDAPAQACVLPPLPERTLQRGSCRIERQVPHFEV